VVTRSDAGRKEPRKLRVKPLKPEEVGIIRRLALAAILLIGITGLGTLGYGYFEGYAPFDALYATVTTMATVGGGEIHPYHLAGKIVTMFLVVFGFIVFTNALVTLIGFVVEGHLRNLFSERRRQRELQQMHDHFILCGYGRIGSEIASEFEGEGIPFVVVDLNEKALEAAAAAGHTVVHGNASELETLQSVGIERARGLVTALDSDADNVYVTLTARVLRPELFIVARVNALDAEPKLRLAGANRIVSPYVIGGRRLARLAMRPTATDFVERILSARNSELLLEDFGIVPHSRWIGQPLERVMQGYPAVFVLAVKRGDQVHFRPSQSFVLEAGDDIVFAGPVDDIRQLEAKLA